MTLPSTVGDGGAPIPDASHGLRVALPLLGTRVVGQGLEFLAWVVLARRLGAGDFGSLSVAFLVCRYGGLIADWGASARGARDVASMAATASIERLMRRRLLLAIVLTAGVAAACAATSNLSLAPLSLTVLARGLGRDWVALGHGRGLLSGMPSALQGALLLTLAMVAHSSGAAAWAAGAAYLTAAVVSVSVNRLGGKRIAATDRETQPHAWMLLALLTDQVSATMDTILLATLRSATAAGVYAAVYRIPNAWITVLGLVAAGMVPAATRAARDPRTLAVLAARWRRVALCSAAAVAASSPLSVVAVPLIFGAAYDDGRAALAILLLATAATTLSAPFLPLYLGMGRDREMALISSAGAAVSLVGYLVLIPPLGPLGAALGTLLAQLSICGLLHLRIGAMRPYLVPA